MQRETKQCAAGVSIPVIILIEQSKPACSLASENSVLNCEQLFLLACKTKMFEIHLLLFLVKPAVP